MKWQRGQGIAEFLLVFFLVVLVVLVLFVVLMEDEYPPEDEPSSHQSYEAGVFRMAYSSSQKVVVEELVMPKCGTTDIRCDFVLVESLDLAWQLREAAELGSPELLPYDAVWLESGLALNLSQNTNLDELQPIMSTALVAAVPESVILDWLGVETFEELVTRAARQEVKLWYPDPVRTDLGALFYFGLTTDSGYNLDEEKFENQPEEEILGQLVQITGEVTPTVREALDGCVTAGADCGLVVTYESLLVEKNRYLESREMEKWIAIYPLETTLVEMPVAFVPHEGEENQTEKRQLLKDLQTFLSSPEALQYFDRVGWRTNRGRFEVTEVAGAKSVWWGIQPHRVIEAPLLPHTEEAQSRLAQFWSEFQLPLNTVYCLDGSKSMSGANWDKVRELLTWVLMADNSVKNESLFHPNDNTTVIIFKEGLVRQPYKMAGHDYDETVSLLDWVGSYEPDGRSDAYWCLNRAIDVMKEDTSAGGAKVIVLVTDGEVFPSGYRLIFNEMYQLVDGVLVVIVTLTSEASNQALEEIALFTRGEWLRDTDKLPELLRQIRVTR